MFGLFSRENKELKRALRLIKLKASADKELSQLKPRILRRLQKMKAERITLKGYGSAIVKFNVRRELNTEQLYKLLKDNPELLRKFVTELTVVKQGALEKQLGSPVYHGLIRNTETAESVVFVAE